VPDFTSALYLGLTHEAATLRPWKQLTTGKPSALQTLPGALALAADLAALTGSEAASLGPSTLHLFWDLFEQWPHRSSVIYADAELYETGRWGIERAAWRGVRTVRVNHYDVESLRRALGRDDARGAPVVVADGFCPDCGRVAPVPSYLDLLKRSRGWLVIDDTQALGILGHSPAPNAPLGRGGGGTLRWYGAPAERVIKISSLAKSFGVPVAMLGGPRDFVERFNRLSKTRVHCSGISWVELHAAEEAVAFNERSGDRTRAYLAQLILRLQLRLAGSKIRLSGGMFPVQAVGGYRDLPAAKIQRRLESAEVQTVLQRDRKTGEPRVGILLTARHTSKDVDRLAAALLAATARV
jgi:8-amino-7-oxononanoate synthase